MVSRSVWDREGGGSSPPWVTTFLRLRARHLSGNSSVGRARARGARGRGIEAHFSDHFGVSYSG